MTIQTLDQLTIVELIEPLKLRGFKQLLGYIAETLPGDISYQVSYFGNFFHNPTSTHPEHPTAEQGSVSVGGTIKSLKRQMAFDTFGTLPSEKDFTRIKAIRFSQIPGYDLQDYRKEVVTLWQEVAKCAKSYFKK